MTSPWVTGTVQISSEIAVELWQFLSTVIIKVVGAHEKKKKLYIVRENEKLVFWHAPGFPNVILWTVSVVSTPILQLMSYVWWKLKVDRHTRTKVIPLQLSRFCNINSSLNLDQKTETVKTSAL